MAFATNRVHGLGLTAAEFWNSTQRELNAHIKVLDRSGGMLAAILAALHNGPLVRKDERLWTIAEFMPGYVPPKVDPRLAAMKNQMDFELLRARFHKPTVEEQDMQRQIAHRMNRARQAEAAGASSEQIQNIMRGLL